MGLYFGRGSLRDAYRSLPPVAQPDPYNFQLVEEVGGENHVLVRVKYPDATNFEGEKIILIHGMKTLKGVKCLDPHFLEQSGITVVARFRPTFAGWELGKANLKALEAQNG